MSRKIALFCALIGVLAFVAGPVYAEVQNIKVSGDITAMGVYRNNYDLEDSRNVSVLPGLSVPGTGEYITEDQNSLLMSIIRLRVDADLTDNVAVAVRLNNQREWDVQAANDNDIRLDLAYITLKEMLYSPLTLVIGRQTLNYGDGLIVGSGRYIDIDAALLYDDLSALHGYDAVRAILDYDPWTLDLLYAKMDDREDAANGLVDVVTNRGRDSDIDLYGANLGYRFNQYDAEMEGYLFFKRDKAYNLIITPLGEDSDSNGRTFEENDVYTLGLRGSYVPVENLTLNAEIAGQLGEISDNQAGPDGQPLERDRGALAANVAGEYNFANTRFTPALGLEYLYLSGEEDENNGDFDAWDPMYRGKIMGSIRDHLETIYTTNDLADTSGWTNQHTVKVKGSMDLGELVDGLSLDLAYLHYWFDEVPFPVGDDDIGDEVNMRLTYDYTEDVQFCLDGAVFMPGDFYDKEVRAWEVFDGGGMNTGANAATNRSASDNAVSVVGSCKVTF